MNSSMKYLNTMSLNQDNSGIFWAELNFIEASRKSDRSVSFCSLTMKSMRCRSICLLIYQYTATTATWNCQPLVTQIRQSLLFDIPYTSTVRKRATNPSRTAQAHMSIVVFTTFFSRKHVRFLRAASIERAFQIYRHNSEPHVSIALLDFVPGPDKWFWHALSTSSPRTPGGSPFSGKSSELCPIEVLPWHEKSTTHHR